MMILRYHHLFVYLHILGRERTDYFKGYGKVSAYIIYTRHKTYIQYHNHILRSEHAYNKRNF